MGGRRGGRPARWAAGAVGGRRGGRRAGRLPFADHPQVRPAGLCFALLSFHWPSEQVFYVPVSIVLGAVLTWWLLLPKRMPADDHLVLRAAGIAVRLARFDRAAERARASLVRSVDSGNVVEKIEEYQKLENAVPVTPAGRTATVPEGATARDLRDRLTLGGRRHGCGAALIGLVLGLPWIALDTWYAARDWSVHGFRLVDLVDTTAWVILQWPIIRFFLGWFYPYIRGRNGITKGLTLLVTLLVPFVAYRAVINQHDLWLDLLRWALELTLFTILLGLVAGDVLILKRFGLGWGSCWSRTASAWWSPPRPRSSRR
ncbi:hypothetical protein [Phytohabitans suffuscus]